MRNNLEISAAATADDEDFLESYEESLLDEEPSRLRSVIFFVLCTMLVIATVAYGAVDQWATALLSVLAGVVVLLWLGYSFFNREIRFSTSLLQLPLLGLILIGLLQLLPLGGVDLPKDLLAIPASGALSLDPYATRLFLVQLFIYFVFFAACLTFLENQGRQRIMVFTIIVFGSLMAFFGIIQSLTNTNPNSILGIRESPGAFPFATFVNRHHFAALMNMIIGLTLGLLYGDATKRDKRLLLVIALVLMGIAMMFTGSRGGILSLFGVVAFVIILNLSSKKSGDEEFGEKKASGLQRNALLIGSGAVLILLLIGSASFFSGENSMVTRGIGLENQGDISNGRTHFWKIALQIFLNNPILGAGLDAFGAAFTKYDTWNGFNRVEQAHNDYLQILADAGLSGFLCVAVFIFFLFKQGLRIIRRSDDRFRTGTAIGALAGCVGILIHSFFDFPLRTPANAFFFLTLASLATIATFYSPNHKKRRRRRSEEA